MQFSGKTKHGVCIQCEQCIHVVFFTAESLTRKPQMFQLNVKRIFRMISFNFVVASQHF